MLILPLLGFMLLLRGGRDGRLKILLLGLLGLQPRLTVVTGLGGGVAWRRNGPNMKNWAFPAASSTIIIITIISNDITILILMVHLLFSVPRQECWSTNIFRSDQWSICKISCTPLIIVISHRALFQPLVTIIYIFYSLINRERWYNTAIINIILLISVAAVTGVCL